MIVVVPWLPFKLDGLALRYFIFIKRGHEKSRSLILHEQVHIEQQKAIGFIRYCWKYIDNKDFRYAMELQAYHEGTGLSKDEASKVAYTYM